MRRHHHRCWCATSCVFGAAARCGSKAPLLPINQRFLILSPLPSLQGAVYLDYGTAKQEGWEPGDYAPGAGGQAGERGGGREGAAGGGKQPGQCREGQQATAGDGAS